MPLPDVTPIHDAVSPDRELRLGVEIEIPLRPEEVKPLTAMGVPSDDEKYRSIELGHAEGGEMTYERIGKHEYGIEARTPPGGVPYYDIPEWYEHSIEEIEDKFGREMEPVGFYGDTTAGLHTHISPLTGFQARKLYELSCEPWMHVFTGSSIASRTPSGENTELFPVFRGGNRYTKYCQLSFNQTYNSVVASCDGAGHYEWRLPEPMHAEQFDLIVEFIARFMNDIDDAAEWAKSIVHRGDNRLTAVKRAQAIDESVSSGDFQTEATRLLDQVS